MIERKPDDVVSVDAYGLGFWCEGCNETHRIPVNQPSGTSWQWNGDRVKPTLSPSIHCLPVPEISVKRCHSFVRNGMIEFLSDCEHALAGKTVPLLTEDQRSQKHSR